MEHKLFKPKGLEEGKHAVVGNCNGIPMQERWDAETPAFAKEIVKYCPEGGKILDYGCGVGRLAKAVLELRPDIHLVGVDASTEMIRQAKEYVKSDGFACCKPEQLSREPETFDVVYCVYVLQHIPAIDIRTSLQRMHFYLKKEGKFIYCSSDYRMAIRFDNAGFYDDRHLGVNLQDEISRYFKDKEQLFDQTIFDTNHVINTMVNGGLKHPALKYNKKTEDKPLFDYVNDEVTEEVPSETLPEPEMPAIPVNTDTKDIVLINRLAPGDILVMTNCIRDLKKAHPEYRIDVRTPAGEIFDNNPHITKLDYSEEHYKTAHNHFVKNPSSHSKESRTWMLDNNVLAIDMQYPSIHASGLSGDHFSQGHGKFLEGILGIKIPQQTILPEIYLSETEKQWTNQVIASFDWDEPYWVINAGSKSDFPLKQYHRYQEVVDLLKDKVKFVQIGQKAHRHKPLDGVFDLMGKTTLRQLFRLIYHSHGVLTCVSLPMHVAAAFQKPCVVVAGAREGTRWELYPNHQFIYVNGCLPCATYDGCWRSKVKDCANLMTDDIEGGVPLCMKLIRPEDVARSIERYYEGGMLTYADVTREKVASCI